MERIEPMDILSAPSPEEVILAKIAKWVKTSKDDLKENCTTVVFKKNTPQSILDLFQKNTDLFVAITDLKVKKNYKIEN
ncbi:hypothetical protein EFM11_09445 [Lactobacillus helveticus]|uniref:hypothetical protein n=1 Tax=Lactobacillus helveticus TaxID=1587 RepID=UPI0021822FBF|nr:hypothetical protein [Lactobacillus helveticus]MCT0165533.1 hypothetical protein [Lactobacillus helveticus]MCT0193311.1 hypothetical protein [Lactobacillus helveticus]